MQSTYKPPRTTIIALRHFVAEPGHVVSPGERVEVINSTANTAIACGNARLPTADDAAVSEQLFQTRDPAPGSRDPKPRRR